MFHISDFFILSSFQKWEVELHNRRSSVLLQIYLTIWRPITAGLLLWNTYRKCWQQLNNDQEEQIHQVSLHRFQTAVNTSCTHFILKVYRWHSGWKTFNVKYLEEVMRKQEKLEWRVGLKSFVFFIYLIYQWWPSFVYSLRLRDNLNFFFLNNVTLKRRWVLEQNVPLNSESEK